MAVLYGIDVSEHNGIIDWEQVKASGKVQFAMLRAGYGQTAVDKQFRTNAAACNRVGIPIGAYWFSYASSTKAAEQEARACVETIKDYKIDYPVAFDYEDDSVRVNKSAGVVPTRPFATALAKAFLPIIAANGYKASLYTNPAYLNSYFDYSQIVLAMQGKLSLWLAQWPVNPKPEAGPPQPIFLPTEIWQYRSTGKIPGIKTDVDLNACYVDYFAKDEEEAQLNDKITMESLSADLRLANQKSWFEKEENGMSLLDLAKSLGFTDGANPYTIPSRAEVMTMITRAYLQLRSEIRSATNTDDGK